MVVLFTHATLIFSMSLHLEFERSAYFKDREFKYEVQQQKQVVSAPVEF